MEKGVRPARSCCYTAACSASYSFSQSPGNICDGPFRNIALVKLMQLVDIVHLASIEYRTALLEWQNSSGDKAADSVVFPSFKIADISYPMVPHILRLYVCYLYNVRWWYSALARPQCMNTPTSSIACN